MNLSPFVGVFLESVTTFSGLVAMFRVRVVDVVITGEIVVVVGAILWWEGCDLAGVGVMDEHPYPRRTQGLGFAHPNPRPCVHKSRALCLLPLRLAVRHPYG